MAVLESQAKERLDRFPYRVKSPPDWMAAQAWLRLSAQGQWTYDILQDTYGFCNEADAVAFRLVWG